MINLNKFLFVGDSYTWGEGLELENPMYIQFMNHIIGYETPQTPQWKQHGYSHSYFHDISAESNSYRFRLNNSFPTLVGDEFNAITLINEYNGGNNQASIDKIKEIYAKIGKIDLVVFQMTHALRDVGLFVNYINHKQPQLNFTHENMEVILNKIMPSWMGIDSMNLKEYKLKDNFDLFFNETDIWNYSDFMKVREIFPTHSDFFNAVYQFLYSYYIRTLQDFKSKNFFDNLIIIGSWSNMDIQYEAIIKNNKSVHPSMFFLKQHRLKINENINSIFTLQETIDDTSYQYGYPDEYKNHHPTKKAHKIIADSLIKHIDENFSYRG